MCQAKGLKLILVNDNISINKISNARECVLLSKKISIELVTKLTITRGAIDKESKPELTKQELRVMNSLTNRTTAAKLSGDRCLSVKTISAYKISTLKKMGLNRRSTRSIVIYRNKFQIVFI